MRYGILSKVPYERVRREEMENKEILLDFQDDYPDVINKDNLSEILKAAKEKMSRTHL